MQISSFLAELKHRDGIRITESVILFRNSFELYDLDTNTTLAKGNNRNRFDETILDTVIGDNTLRKIIASWDCLPRFAERGGNGSSSGFSSTGYPAGGKGFGSPSTPDFPARMNLRVESQEKTLEFFREKHANDSKESAVLVDERGFTHRYVHGESSSVEHLSGMGIVYHNHPAHGWPVFSREDLINTATDRNRGIVASSGLKGRDASTAKYAGDYKFEKTAKFDSKGFVKALNSARISGKDLNDGSTKWLKANQKKYGYTFTFKKASK